jgi:hypothetical protein
VRTALAFVLGICVTGCAVGPNFKQPAAPTVQSYLPEALPEQTESAPGHAGDAQRFVAGMDVPAQWWAVFQSPELDDLIAQAFKTTPHCRAHRPHCARPTRTTTPNGARCCHLSLQTMASLAKRMRSAR